MSPGSTPFASVSVTVAPDTAIPVTVWPGTASSTRVTVTVNPPGAAGTDASSSGSSKVSVSRAPFTAAAVTIGASVSGVTLTATASLPVKPSASLPAASRTFAPEEGGRYSRVAFWVPSAIRSASVRRSFVASVPSTATAVTAGPLPVPILTPNPPASLPAEAGSSASDQVTTTVSPSAAAAVAVGRTPSTVRAGSAPTASWPSCTARLPARIALPAGAASAFAGIAMPSLSASPATTAYSKRSLALPEPEA